MTLEAQIAMNNGIGGHASQAEPKGTFLADLFAEPATPATKVPASDSDVARGPFDWSTFRDDSDELMIDVI